MHKGTDTGRSTFRATKTKFATYLMVSISLLIGSVAIAPQASAAGGVSVIRNWATGNCLDSNTKGEVYARLCSENNNYQRWTWDFDGHSGDYDVIGLRNRATGLWLSMRDGGSSVHTTGIFENNWQGVGPDWQHVQLRASGKCLDSTRAGAVGPNPCNGGGNQLWHFQD